MVGCPAAGVGRRVGAMRRSIAALAVVTAVAAAVAPASALGARAKQGRYYGTTPHGLTLCFTVAGSSIKGFTADGVQLFDTIAIRKGLRVAKSTATAKLTGVFRMPASFLSGKLTYAGHTDVFFGRPRTKVDDAPHRCDG